MRGNTGCIDMVFKAGAFWGYSERYMCKRAIVFFLVYKFTSRALHQELVHIKS